MESIWQNSTKAPSFPKLQGNVRAVLTSQKSTDSLKLVAKALYLYHQAAEAYQQA